MRIPTGILGRLRLVGESRYGRQWMAKLADDLGVTRMAMHRWMQEIHATPDDLDLRLLQVLRADNDRSRHLHKALSAFLRSQALDDEEVA